MPQSAKSWSISERKKSGMNKTPLQIFEERNEKDCCLNCGKLIVKQTDAGHINFCGETGKIILDMFLDVGTHFPKCKHERKEEPMRIQNHIPIKAVAIREEDGLEIGTEYDVEDIMMGQSNTSVSLVGMKGSFNSISFKFMHDGREIDIFRSPLINPYMRFNGNNGICYKE